MPRYLGVRIRVTLENIASADAGQCGRVARYVGVHAPVYARFCVLHKERWALSVLAQSICVFIRICRRRDARSSADRMLGMRTAAALSRIRFFKVVGSGAQQIGAMCEHPEPAIAFAAYEPTNVSAIVAVVNVQRGAFAADGTSSRLLVCTILIRCQFVFPSTPSRPCFLSLARLRGIFAIVRPLTVVASRGRLAGLTMMARESIIGFVRVACAA